MPDATPFLAAIRAAPDDDAPRLIYADWLDEHGEPERAELIRVQCELARRESAELRKREAELLAEHRVAFAGPLAAPGLGFRFERGFVVGFGHTGVFAFAFPLSDAISEDYFDILRFYPDGLVLRTTSSSLPPELPNWLSRRYSAITPSGKYNLDAISFPARISFTCMAKDDIADFIGMFQGSCLSLEITEYEWKLDQEYRHVHIAGFDSFQESPQDAV